MCLKSEAVEWVEIQPTKSRGGGGGRQGGNAGYCPLAFLAVGRVAPVALVERDRDGGPVGCTNEPPFWGFKFRSGQSLLIVSPGSLS